MGQIPSTDRRDKGIPAEYSIRFQPGGVQTDYTYTNWDVMISFIQHNREAIIDVFFDTSLSGGEYAIPAGTYNLNGIQLIGIRDAVTGASPRLVFPAGVLISADTTYVYFKNLDVVVQSNTDPVYVPTGATQIYLENAYIIQEGGVHFVQISGTNSDTDPSMVLDNDSGLTNSSSAPLVYVAGGKTYTIGVDDISTLGAETIQYEDDTVLVTILASVNATIGSQTLLAGGSIQIQGPEQSFFDPDLDIDRTYPGKVVHNATSDHIEFRDSSNDLWIELANAEDARQVFTELDDTPSTYAGQSLRRVRVNAGETALEFTPDFGAFLDLDDTPNTYAGSASMMVVVNPGEDGLAYIDPPASTFLGLYDSPVDYTGFAGYSAVVNPAENGVEFVDVQGAVDTLQTILDALQIEITDNQNDIASLSSDLNDKPDSFLELDDTPVNYAGAGGFFPRVNTGGTALVFDAPFRNLIDVNTLISQAPIAVNSPITVAFGPLVSTPDVTLAANGEITFSTAGLYFIDLTLSVGRTGGGAASWVAVRSEVDPNGISGFTTFGNTTLTLVDSADIVTPLKITGMFNAAAGSRLRIRLVRDGNGANSGGLYTRAMAAPGWTDSQTASLKISKVRGA